MQLTFYENLVESPLPNEDLSRLICSKDFFKLDSLQDDSKRHSRLIDRILGFDIKSIENDLLHKAYNRYPQGNMGSWGPSMHNGSQTWIGIDPQTLLTPYSELYDILELLKSFNLTSAVDLGAGYGRLAFVFNSFFPNKQTQFLGHEIVNERVLEGNRIFEKFHLQDSEMIQHDITKPEFELPNADLYFIYDFSNPLHIKDLLRKFSAQYFDSKFFLVARGDGTRSLIQQKFPQFYSLYEPIHHENWSIYSSFTEIRENS